MKPKNLNKGNKRIFSRIDKPKSLQQNIEFIQDKILISLEYIYVCMFVGTPVLSIRY